MKLYHKLLPLLFIIIISACDNKSSNEQPAVQEEEQSEEVVQNLEQELIGEWYNLTLDLVIKADPDSTLHVPDGKWEEIMGMKPIRTTYKGDGTFESVYTSLEGEPLGVSSGTWSLDGAILTMIEHNSENKYDLSIQDGVATFTSELDWDMDGVLDQYSGTQQKAETN